MYEPQAHGAEITSRNIERARYDGNYRISGNFLNWVTKTYCPDLVQRLNAAARAGRYNEELWKTAAGHTVQELGDEWKASMAQRIATETAEAAKANTLSEEEQKAGWKLLFDGKSLDGWHSFTMPSVRPGWQVRDGILTCADPRNAGDLCTNDRYDWFELQIDYNISPAGNSGIMCHVTDEGRAAWATGPEVQLEDNAAATDPVRCGWRWTDPFGVPPSGGSRPPGCGAPGGHAPRRRGK